MLIRAACHSSSAAVWAASAVLTSAARVLVRASSSCFSSPWACGICLPSCFCSARLDSKSAIAARRAESAERARSTTSSDSPRLAWAARTRSGSSRSTFGSIMWQGYRGTTTPSPGIRVHPVDRHTVRRRTASTRREPRARPSPRRPAVAGPPLCLVLFVLLAIAVDQGWQVIRDFDERGDGAQAWAVDADWAARSRCAVVELIFNTIGDGDHDRRARDPDVRARATDGRRTSPSA